MVAAGLALVAVAIMLLIGDDEPSLNSVGPQQGDGAPIYLFQSYDCATCWNATLDGDTQSLADAADAAGFSIIWKNVAPEHSYAAIAAHCAWQQFPARWQEWNHAAFEQQLEAGTGWNSMDRILYMTESEFLLPQSETEVFEACLMSGDFDAQVEQDTKFWSHEPPLPALYADGRWYAATPEAIQDIQTGR